MLNKPREIKFKEEVWILNQDDGISKVPHSPTPPPTSSASDLINKNYWNNKKFSTIFFKRRMRFSEDENENKKEYDLWHNELGKKYYDKALHKFTLDNIPYFSKKYIFYDLLIFLKFHPLLTFKDQQNIKLFKSELDNRIKNYSLGNYFFGLLSFIVYIKIKTYNNLKTPFFSLAKIYSSKFLILFIGSCLFINARHDYDKPYKLIEFLKEQNLIDKYFKNYL
jgi:hypothetical protein